MLLAGHAHPLTTVAELTLAKSIDPADETCGGETMTTKQIVFAVPVFGLLVGALMQPAVAESYSYEKTKTVTTTSSNPPCTENVVSQPVHVVTEKCVEQPARIIQRPVRVLEQPVRVVEQPLIQRSVLYEKHPLVTEPRPVAVERWIAFGHPVLLERPVLMRERNTAYMNSPCSPSAFVPGCGPGTVVAPGYGPAAVLGPGCAGSSAVVESPVIIREKTHSRMGMIPIGDILY